MSDLAPFRIFRTVGRPKMRRRTDSVPASTPGESAASCSAAVTSPSCPQESMESRDQPSSNEG